MASEGFLGVLVILSEMRGGLRYQFDCLGSVFQVKRRRPFIRGTFIFTKETLGSFFLVPGSLDSGVSNKVVPFGRHSPEDISSEFGDLVGYNDMMEESYLVLLYFFSENVNTSVKWNFVLLLLDVMK